MSEIDELTIAYEEDGHVLVRELGKEILSKGAWTTIAYLYQDWDNKKEDFGPKKVTLRRYQKVRGQYRQKSKFNISSLKQADKVVTILRTWLDEDAA